MKQNRKNDEVRVSKTNLYVILLAVVVIVNLFLFGKIVRTNIPPAIYPNKTAKSEQVKTSENNKTQDKTTSKTEKDDKGKLKKGYQYTDVSIADIHSGNLILVNNQNKYVFDNITTAISPEELVSVYSHKTDSYKVKDINTQLNLSIIDSLNHMMDDFKKETGNSSVMIVSAFRGEDEQKSVMESKISQLGEEQGKQIANEPGFSEHHTGYAFDFTLYAAKGKTAEYDGTGDTAWIAENCYKYGFILRYPEGKTDITGIQYEPWHFRYVGIPHAKYMVENKLVMEEYIELLKKHPYNADPITVTDDGGQKYEIYYAPVSDKNLKIAVPKDAEYSLSGNNTDGMIVTVKR